MNDFLIKCRELITGQSTGRLMLPQPLLYCHKNFLEIRTIMPSTKEGLVLLVRGLSNETKWHTHKISHELSGNNYGHPK